MSPGTSPAQAAERLRPAVVDVVEAAGFVLDDLEVRPAGRRQVVRVVVDTAEVPGPHDPPAPGPDLDAVAGVSRELSRVLDESEKTEGDKTESGGTIAAPDGEYTLEVTTPGTDRPLTRPHHWRRAWLRRVAVTRTGGGTLTARVGPVDGTDGGDEGEGAAATVTLAEGTPRGPVLHRLPLAEVRQAVVEVEFKPAPSSEVDALVAAALEQGSGQGAETHGQGGRP
ncbi:ribosome maturation factor RimP [Actinomycetospora callitridis]|uniref:ribosome maturation factor RimP n=1 Tax=Actinomycetospora callitridis TaxID=913944 RepID=UPI002365AF0A|nr:ribosome maturation factor RimP [Actinomycetospora callitridis]MDD7917007.1 ribosome maturation factor RimP [Actinomycetospora callitridis]